MSAAYGSNSTKLGRPHHLRLPPISDRLPLARHAGSCASDERFDRGGNELRYCNMKCVSKLELACTDVRSMIKVYDFRAKMTSHPTLGRVQRPTLIPHLPCG